jgi:AAA family ATP:ADP antiporter
MWHHLRKLVPISRGEGITALLLALNVFILLTCYYILKVVREPLILLGGGAELKAYASAGQALLLLGIVPVFGWLATRLTRMQLLTGVQTFFIGCLLAFYVLAQVHAPIGLAFYLWLGIFSAFVVSNFWSFADDLYTPEQGKRLLGIIGLGGSVGAVLGALVPRLLARYLGTYELMFAAAVGLALSTIIYRVVDRRERRAAPRTAKPAPPMDHAGGFSLVIHDRYLSLIAIMVVVATVVNTTGEYVIGRLVTEASHTAADRGAYIESFYSSYYAVVNVASVLIQGLVVARVLGKLGIRRALFVMPLIVLGGWLAFLVSSTVGMIRITKTTENSVDYSFHNTVRQALFLPTSREAKYKAKAAIDTFFFRAADMISALGVVFVLVHLVGAGVRGFAIVNVALTAVWLAIVYWTGRLHDRRLVQGQRPEPGP